ncbi:ABC transporter ATP-binding protein [Virgibacillus sp. NKC19-3]|uniref:ABC transporter ATP-binding protein n=1 Tax=Virgibacillus saliphilus TaxID=2831674 RepID=UPI001C9A4E7A|nr:ABC transporter ATP-binding protein [Virgibacillus sp. NKC19-3]MBY7141757.1 ABC transporter ATP-binding protein [Virgibacillus sp. NKC19-3]
MENVVEVKDLEKRFNHFALEGINLTVKKGFITGFIGPNGAGKSTAIRCMMNLSRPDQGEVKLFGKTHDADTENIKQRIGFVQDESFFYGHLSLERNKKLIAPFYETWNEKLFARYIEQFELPLGKKVAHLSKGMKMKFSLAMALARDPELIIMDEPTSGLDPVFRRELLELLQDIIQDEEKAVFFSTHITQDLEKVADYITFIDNGKMVVSGEKDAVLDQYAVVKGPNEWLTAQRRRSLLGIRETDMGFDGLLADKQQLAGEAAGRVLLERPSLEDIMFYTVKERQHGHSTSAS